MDSEGKMNNNNVVNGVIKYGPDGLWTREYCDMMRKQYLQKINELKEEYYTNKMFIKDRLKGMRKLQRRNKEILDEILTIKCRIDVCNNAGVW